MCQFTKGFAQELDIFFQTLEIMEETDMIKYDHETYQLLFGGSAEGQSWTKRPRKKEAIVIIQARGAGDASLTRGDGVREEKGEQKVGES